MHVFDLNQRDTPELLCAIERAVVRVAPQLKQTHQYPEAFRKPVLATLEYVHSLACSVPGPVLLDPETYSQDAYVHAIFPSVDHIPEVFRISRAMQEYHKKNLDAKNTYALMGMIRHEKVMMGMELSGEVIQREVPQHVIYFDHHAIVDPASSEQEVRYLIAWRFFNNLVGKVSKRVVSRKQELQMQLEEIDFLKARLHNVDSKTRPKMKKELSKMLIEVQSITRSLDLHHYLDDFEAVLSNPEQHLQLKQTPLIMDSMGIRRNNDRASQGQEIVFSDLIGFDDREWSVTLVYGHNFKVETFSARLDEAYRMLTN